MNHTSIHWFNKPESLRRETSNNTRQLVNLFSYLGGSEVRIDSADEDGRLGHGDGGLLVPVRGDRRAHLQVAAEVGSVAVLVLDHLQGQ